MRAFIVFLLLWPLVAFAGNNKTLGEAQRLFNSASTVAQYQTAKKKFQSAKYDVAYVAAEHDAAINQGIANCNRRIDELSPRLSVSPTSISFGGDGGSRTLTINTNQGSPYATSLPSWITVDNSTYSSITIRCAANPSAMSRTNWFTVCAGNKSVRIDVTQQAGREEKLEITGITFGNSDAEGNLISKAGAPLYASDMKFLWPYVTYKGLTSGQSKKVFSKIYKPDGTLLTGSFSPDGFSYSRDVYFSSGLDSKYVPEIGSSTGGIYPAGSYRYELWIDGKKAYSTSFTILSRETTYLRVTNNANSSSATDGGSLSLNFDADGGSRTFAISTDGAEWTTWGVPSFCEVTSKTSTSMTLKCKANTSTSSRSDYMKIKSGNKEVRINITQDASGSKATIKRVWIDHNVYEDGVKGMRIHCEFTIDNAKGHTVKPHAYFYHNNGDRLKDTDGNYCAPDGQVCTHEECTPRYDSSHWEDFKLFMPNNQLHVSSGDLKFYIKIYDSTAGKFVGESDWQYITIN